MTDATVASAWVREFDDSFRLAVQQKQSRLSGKVLNRGQITGADFTINKFGTVDFANKGARFADTPISHNGISSRLVTMQDQILATMVDPTDPVKMKADVFGPIRTSFEAALNRARDKVIYAALTGSIQEKTAYADSGYAAVALPATQKVLQGTAAITKATLIQVRALFQKNEVAVEDGEELNIIYNSSMLQTILADTTLTSADFLAVQMLQSGKIDESKWLGFNWIPYEAMAAGTEVGSKVGVAWATSGIDFGWSNPTPFRMDTIAGKSYAEQFGGIYSFGAGRNDEKKVVSFEFKDTLA